MVLVVVNIRNRGEKGEGGEGELKKKQSTGVITIVVQSDSTQQMTSDSGGTTVGDSGMPADNLTNENESDPPTAM